MRLYDRLMHDPHDYQQIERPLLDIANAISIMRPVPVDVENVARYLQSHDDEYPNWEYPNLAPPWPFAFYEYRSSPVTPGIKAIGLLIAGKELSPDPRSLPPDTSPRWTLLVNLFTIMRDSNTIIRPAEIAIPLDSHGATFRSENGGPLLIFGCERMKNHVEEHGLPYELDAALMAISLSHCKNVELTTVEPDPKRQRSARKHGRPPLNTYHVLDINPMRKVLREEGRSEEVGLQRALHICRGHFKDFRERGLFGNENQRGVYWWPQHLRGAAEHGTADKSYRINAAEGEAE